VETPIGRITAEHFPPEQVRHRAVVGPKFLYALFNPSDDMHGWTRRFARTWVNILQQLVSAAQGGESNIDRERFICQPNRFQQ
jgi:hypothetical protein